jgi:hypothetical protein
MGKDTRVSHGMTAPLTSTNFRQLNYWSFDNIRISIFVCSSDYQGANAVRSRWIDDILLIIVGIAETDFQCIDVQRSRETGKRCAGRQGMAKAMNDESTINSVSSSETIIASLEQKLAERKSVLKNYKNKKK